jgi:hypothetical protein
MSRYDTYRIAAVVVAILFVVFTNWLAMREVAHYRTETEHARSALHQYTLARDVDHYRDFVRLSLIDTETPDAR